jgi:hypothetical protein
LRNALGRRHGCGMDKFWTTLAKSKISIGDASASGVGILCLTVIVLCALFFMR